MEPVHATTDVVSFRQMKNGTREDYLLLDSLERDFARRLPERIIHMLGALAQSLEGYQVNRLTHSLQAATRAEQDGADDELIVAALIRSTTANRTAMVRRAASTYY